MLPNRNLRNSECTSQYDVQRRRPCSDTLGFLIVYFTKHKKCLNGLIFILSISAILLLRLLYVLSTDLRQTHVSYQQYRHNMLKNDTRKKFPTWPYGGRLHDSYGFHPVNEKGVYSFWNVCIEARTVSTPREMDYLGKKIQYQETKKIVVYDSFYRTGIQKLYVAGSHNSPWNQWDLHFTRESIPSTHEFHASTAFFLTQTCPANFHHFWIDEFVPLFCVVKQANKLRAGAANQIIYRLPSNLTEASTRGCYNKTLFEDVLATLYISEFHDVFYHMKTNSCFSSAVFGIAAIISTPRTVVAHVLQQLNVTLPPAMDCYVTIVQRNHRCIINARELAKAVKLMGFRKVRIVNLERLDVKAQARVAASSRVMIGVQGAGLQWAAFMSAGSSLIEIAWPHKFWGFYFQNYVTQYQITHYELRAHVRVNWTSYEQLVRSGIPVSMEERLQLLQSRPKTSSLDNIWKWADAIVNKDALIEILSRIDFSASVTERTLTASRSQTQDDSYDVLNSLNISLP